jgi:hypothetical protein
MAEVFIAPPGTDPTEPGWSWLGTTTAEDTPAKQPRPLTLTPQRIADMFGIPLHLITPDEETHPCWLR